MKPTALPITALAALLAAQPPSGVAQTFTEDISILEVEVPVRVLVDGRPLRGLTRADFELLVDGEPQELSWFEAIEIDETATGGVATGPPESSAAAPGRAPEAVWRRHHLLLFDFGFSSRYRIRRALDGVRRMVATQGRPSDRLAIAIFAEAVGARILVPFTSDRRAVELGLDFLETLTDAKTKRAVESLEALDAWWAGSPERGALPEPLLADMGSRGGTLIQPIARPVEPAGVGLPIARDGPSGASPSETIRAARLDSIVAMGGGSLSAVRALGRSMAGLVTLLRDVPEPKHLLFLSQGLGGGLFGGDDTRTPVLHRLKRMLDACGDTGWILHAIDIGGIPAPASTVLMGPEDLDASVEIGLGVPATAGAEAESLFYLANETGGELFENYNRIEKATAKLLERTEASYLLAFQPRELEPDGERYEIEVRLVPKIRDARVVHRPSFRAPRPATERPLPERRMDAAELVLAGPTIDELAVRVVPVVLPPAGPEAGHGRVPVFVTVGTEGLDSGKKGRKRVRLDAHGYALDDAGRVRAGFAHELKFHLEDQREIVLADEISLPSGTHELRVLAWDLRGGRRHLSTTRLEVPVVEPAIPWLRGPLFLATDAGRRQFSPGTIEARDALALFQLDDGLAALDPLPAIARGRSRRFLLLAVGLPEIDPPEVRLGLRAADGSPLNRSITLDRLSDGAGGTARFTGLLDTRGLAAGRYRLEARLGASVSAAELTVVEPE